MISPSPLFSLFRGGFEEIVAHGEVVVCDARGPCFQSGTAIGSYPARSLLKPFQFLSAGLPRERWALRSEPSRYVACLGSISATEEQVGTLEEWYATPELQERARSNRVPTSYPMDERFRVSLKSRKQPAEQRYHTCFSKHMGILESCDLHGWPREGYLSSEHPFHRRLAATLGDLLGAPLSPTYVTDGCGLPSPVLSLTQMAQLYRSLATLSLESPLGEIRALMQQAPGWIGGPGRVDTGLMSKNAGQLVAKDGADGLLGVGLVPSARFPQGLGIVVKIAAGYYPPLAALALAPFLERLGLVSVHQVPRGQEIAYHYGDLCRAIG